MPTRPELIDTKIKSYTNSPVPYFFKYAKDKEDYQVSHINNSFVNRLNAIIPNPRINCRKLGLGDIDYTLLMENPDIEFDVVLGMNNQLIEEESEPLLAKYYELNKKYYNKIGLCDDNLDLSRCTTSSSLRHALAYKNIAKEIKHELSQFGYTERQVTDILVKYLYGIKQSKRKETLWFCYGKYILESLESNIKRTTKIVECVECGELIETNIYTPATCRCAECRSEHKRLLKREEMQRYRAKKSIKYPL